VIGSPMAAEANTATMLSSPIASKDVTPGKRPRDFSNRGNAICGLLSSTKYALTVLLDRTHRLESHLERFVATTVFARHARENTPLGLFPAAK
jgi:hypothetical protein